ncbi:MAG: membrane protein insertase YidC, partial [Bacteroidetes bacterium]|nr:membrane protein insertase YidC [Bacteroidota bacterium]
MDRNTVIGFVLLAILLFGYLFYSTKNQHELEARRLRQEDSIARIAAQKQAAAAKVAATTAAAAPKDTTAAGKIFTGEEKTVTVENQLIQVVFSNKGGQPKSVKLKTYRSMTDGPVELANDSSDHISYKVLTGSQDKTKNAAFTNELYFSEPKVTRNADSSQSVVFQLQLPGGGTVIHQYTIRPASYLVDFDIQFTGINQLFSQNTMQLEWATTAVQHEHTSKYEREQSQIIYLLDDGYDYNTMLRSTDTKLEKPVSWLSVKQQFFNVTLINKQKFESGDVKWTHVADDTSKIITQATATLVQKLPQTQNASIPLQIYYGPNDYKILHNLDVPKMDKIINLGQGPYSFVRPINQYIIIPVFNFLRSFAGSMGIVILLLTLFIRLLTSPLVYTSYLSGAKMKALRPELEVLKKKFPDQQAYSMEQMKLFREVGVNPLGGCIPALLQIPIFFALYSLFNSSIALRGEHFLWAKDLSTYDSIAHLPFSIPGYGDHVSLF